jgi:hypothetical protein
MQKFNNKIGYNASTQNFDNNFVSQTAHIRSEARIRVQESELKLAPKPRDMKQNGNIKKMLFKQIKSNLK